MTHETFRIEYIHPVDGKFMSFEHGLDSKERTSRFLKLVKWAMISGVELRIRPMYLTQQNTALDTHAA